MAPPEFAVPSKLEDLVGSDQPFAVEEIEVDEALQAFDGAANFFPSSVFFSVTSF